MHTHREDRVSPIISHVIVAMEADDDVMLDDIIDIGYEEPEHKESGNTYRGRINSLDFETIEVR